METKKCSKCSNILLLTQFYKDKNKPLGCGSQCKNCKNNATKKRRLTNKNSNIEIPDTKLCVCCNEIKLNIEFYKTTTNKNGLSIYCKKCRLKNEQTRIANKKIANVVIDESIIKKCSVCNLNKSLNQYKINLKSNDNFSNICIDCSPKSEHTVEKQRAYEKKYRQNNPEKMKEKYKRQSKNINRRIRDSLNHRISGALKSNNNKKINKTIKYTGCEISFFKKWIENLFQDKMSWENYGEWHLDHVKPCASYDLSDEAQINECFNWKNYQPLWKINNLIKSDKIDEQLINEHNEKVKNYILTLNSAQLKEGELFWDSLRA